MTPIILGHLGQQDYSYSFPTPRESWLCPHSGPQRDQLPALHASSRLKHLLEAPGAWLLAGYCGMKYRLASWSVTMKDETPVPAESQSFLLLAWPPAHRPPQSPRRLSSDPMLHTVLSSLQPPHQHPPTSCYGQLCSPKLCQSCGQISRHSGNCRQGLLPGHGDDLTCNC